MGRSALPLFLLLVACGSESQAPSCDADRWGHLVGQQEAALSEVDGDLRVIRPDTVITMDFNPMRLNVKLNDAGRIVAFGCY